MLQVYMLGTLGRDPETKYSESGAANTQWSMVHNERWKDKNTGEKKERSEWVNCISFGPMGEIIGKYVKKGQQLVVRGTLRTNKYEKDGEQKQFTSLVVQDFEFVRNGEPSGNTTQEAPSADSFGDFGSSHIPF